MTSPHNPPGPASPAGGPAHPAAPGGPAPIWQPDPVVAGRSILTAFTRQAEHGIELPDYAALWRWSTQRIAG